MHALSISSVNKFSRCRLEAYGTNIGVFVKSGKAIRAKKAIALKDELACAFETTLAFVSMLDHLIFHELIIVKILIHMVYIFFCLIKMWRCSGIGHFAHGQLYWSRLG